MKYSVLAFALIFQFMCFAQLSAQMKCGTLANDSSQSKIIERSVYHQYDLNLEKETVVLLNMTDFDVRTELTVVSPEGILVEQVNTSETADFLIFESPAKGKYQFYIKIIKGEKASGKYKLSAHYIPNENNNRLDQIKQLIDLLEKPQRAGTAISIIKDGKIVFENYNGYSNVENRIKNNDKTVFELASVSKQFTAMAIAKLAEQNKLSVEDDIRIYFPELPIYKSTIKIKHLLNHTSGIIDSEYPLALAGFENDPIQIDRVLNFLSKTPEQYFESGSEFSYSNDGYTLLGELVHRVTKKSFKNWAKQNMFDPLKMENTLVRDNPEDIIPNRAISYVSYTGDDHFRRLSFDFHAPGGCSVRSNIIDLSKWVNYLNKGYKSDKKLFQRINKLENFENGDTMEYAYGAFITDFRGLKRFSHLGLAAGFTTSIARFPEEDLGFIFLGNDGEFRNYYLSRKIYEIYLGQKLKPRTKKFKGIEISSSEQEVENSNQAVLKDLNLSEYEGSYFAQQINTTYSFQLIQDTLFAISSAYKRIPLTAVAVDTFQTEEDFMTTIIFKRDYNQDPSNCNIYNDNDDQKIEFRKFITTTKPTKNSNWYSKEHQQNMRDKLEEIEATNILSGFAVSVFDESETLFQEGFGFANIKDKKAYNPETVQLTASVSKSISGMAVMKAMELGHFKLDDPINEYLPHKIINPNFPEDDITIRHLLTHTSSLDDPTNYDHAYVFKKSLEKENWPEPHHKGLSVYNNNEKLSISTFLEMITSPNGKWYNEAEMFTKQRPGTNFEYSNLGFALLGYIIELTSKVDFKAFTQKHIFDPLDMKSATWELEKIDPIHQVTYYLENYYACPDYAVITLPDGGLYINIIDLSKFLQEAIKGYFGRGTILSQSSYSEMFKNQSELFEIEGGLGWDLSVSCCIGHAGNDFGASTVMYFEPRTGLGRIVFSNISSETDLIEDTFYGIMNLLFK